MDFYSAFNIAVPASPPSAGIQPRFGAAPSGKAAEPAAPGGEGQGQSVGVFVSPQSIASFSGATALIAGLWQGLKSLNILPASAGPWAIFGLSLVVGVLIYFINVTDPKGQYSGRDKLIAAVLALFNTVLLFNASKSLVGG